MKARFIHRCFLAVAALSLVASAEGAAIDHPSDLVGWWTGDNNPKDYSGNGNHGTLQNSATYGTGNVNNGFALGATSDDHVSVASSSSLSVSSFTIMAWVYPDVDDSQPVVEYSTSTSAAGVHFWVGGGNGSFTPYLLQMNVRSGGANYSVHTNYAVYAGNWSHIACTFDQSSGHALIYLNGVAVMGDTFASITPDTSLPIWIGKRPNGSQDALAGANFDGAIDEVQIYSRALSSTEIGAAYNAGSSGHKRATYSVSVPGSSGGVGGFQLLAHSLEASTVGAVYPTATSGDQLSFWNPSTASYTTHTYSSGAWSGSGATRTLSPGEGYWYWNSTGSAKTLNFYGAPPSGSVAKSMTVGLDYQLGAAHPGFVASGTSANEIACGSNSKSLGWSPSASDQIHLWNSGTQQYTTYNYDPFDLVWSPSVPALAQGLGAVFEPAASKTWTQVVGGTSCP